MALDRDSDFYNGIIEDEEYHCEKCGKVFSMRMQHSGIVDFDDGVGRCEICYKVLCDDCANWHGYNDKYKKICLDCFNKEMLYDFSDWYDVFKHEYCRTDCDACYFFFKEGCIMMLSEELVRMTFNPGGSKKAELEKIQRRNRQAEKEWAKQLHEFNIKPRKRGK